MFDHFSSLIERRTEEAMNKVVLLTGEYYTTEMSLTHLAIIWECLKNSTLRTAIVNVKDMWGVDHVIDVRRIDPDKTLHDVVYNRLSMPEMAVETGDL